MAGPLAAAVTGPGPVHLLHGAVVLPDAVVPDGVVASRGGTILHAGPASSLPALGEVRTEPLPPDTVLLPGLVDLHCHGGGGAELGPDEAACRRAADHHHRAGTTSLVASLVSAPPDLLVEGMRSCAGLVGEGVLAGVHTEGPFLAPVRCGAQDPLAVRGIDLDLVDRLAEAADGHWSVMTYAPELPGAEQLVRRLLALGVVPAVGHTDATMAVTASALAQARGEDGDRPALATHLFNAMPPLHHRAPGPVAACLAALARGEAVAELVADGVHVDDGTTSMLWALAAPGSIALVTDAMAAAGMPDGRYTLGRLDVEVREGTARLVPGGAIAGGTAALLDVVRRCVQRAGVPLAEAVRAASLTPASLLGIDGVVGSLSPGRRADVVAVDAHLSVRAVWRGGVRLSVPRP